MYLSSLIILTGQVWLSTPGRRRDGWKATHLTWAKQSYTMIYLEYKVEVDQVDLTNPFHIEESNLVRSRLVKKQKKKDKVGVEG